MVGVSAALLALVVVVNDARHQLASCQRAALRIEYLPGGPGRHLWLPHGWPEWSHVWRPVITRLSEFFTDLEFGVAPGAGHFVRHETPDQAAEEVRRFFVRCPRLSAFD